MGCCQSAEPGETDRLLGEGDAANAPAASAAKPAEGNAYQGAPAANGGGLFQQGAAPQLATMQDDVKGDAVIGEDQQKAEDGDAAAAAKQEDSKSAAVINETQKKLIDLTGNEEEEDAAAPKMDKSIRVGAADTLVAVPTSPAKESSGQPVAVAAGAADDDMDDDLDLAGASVPVSREGDMARRMGSSLAADVHSLAAQPAPEAKEVVKSLGEVQEESKEEPKGEEPKAQEAPAEP